MSVFSKLRWEGACCLEEELSVDWVVRWLVRWCSYCYWFGKGLNHLWRYHRRVWVGIKANQCHMPLFGWHSLAVGWEEIDIRWEERDFRNLRNARVSIKMTRFLCMHPHPKKRLKTETDKGDSFFARGRMRDDYVLSVKIRGAKANLRRITSTHFFPSQGNLGNINRPDVWKLMT